MEIFRAGWQGKKVRMMQAITLLLWTPFLLYGAYLFVVAPEAEPSRLVHYGTAALFLVLAVGSALGAIVYGGSYVLRAVWNPGAGCCHMTLVGVGRREHVDVPAAGSAQRCGRGGVEVTVRGVWHVVRVPGRRFPLIVDGHGGLISPAAVVGRVLMGEGSALPPGRRAEASSAGPLRDDAL
ncbi:MAG TPA: hypothetical protein VE913_21035 [Longimicrobium sp.]|nr:hypothetical protein [Longimicrobium sp.]